MIKLKVFMVQIKHYLADGGAELISKAVLGMLKEFGATYSWNPADTPELNSTTERRYRTLGERCLSLLLRSSLPTEFWWDAYQTSNYITVRLPTKTKKGYITPFECLTGQVPDLKHLRVWGCKMYLRMPRNYQRKDWREKPFVGYLIGYSEDAEIGYKMYCPDRKEVLVGCTVCLTR